jgi:hypothetical protein
LELPLAKVVASEVPFHFTTEADANPAPFSVKVKAGPPGAVLIGTSD